MAPNAAQLRPCTNTCAATRAPTSDRTAYLVRRPSPGPGAGRRQRRLRRAPAGPGVAKGEPVALFMNNCPQYLMAHYGIQKIGAIVRFRGPLNKEHELEYQLTDPAGNEPVRV